jgi:hypothetical protein
VAVLSDAPLKTLIKERMETIDDETTAAKDFIKMTDGSVAFI